MKEAAESNFEGDTSPSIYQRKHMAIAATNSVLKNTEYVTIPATDLFDNPHPSLWLNRDEYKPGMSHLVTEDIAASLKERLQVFKDSQIRILRPQSSNALRGNQNPVSNVSNSGE